jgi:hypothetical protein
MTVQEILFDYTKGSDARLPCDSCVSITYHVVLQSTDVKIGFMSAVGFEHYQIVQCQGCRNISFRTFTKKPDFLAVVRPERKAKPIVTTEELYPQRNIERRVKVDLLAVLPAEVMRIYRETNKALLNSQPVLAGIGVRALLEAICVERAAKGPNLQAKINSLVILGLLTQGNADFLHSLRILGNQAAHKVVPHGEEKLGLAMDLIEHLLTTVYLIPAKASKLLTP